MSLWDVEITKLDGMLKAYVRIQNDYTGQISGSLRSVKKKDGHYYVKADGADHNIDYQVSVYQNHTDYINKAVEFYKKYGGSNYLR